MSSTFHENDNIILTGANISKLMKHIKNGKMKSSEDLDQFLRENIELIPIREPVTLPDGLIPEGQDFNGAFKANPHFKGKRTITKEEFSKKSRGQMKHVVLNAVPLGPHRP